MEPEKEPSIGISLSVELPSKKALVLQSFVPRDCPQKDLNECLDKLRVASERQFAFGLVEILKMQLEQEKKNAADHVMRMAQVDENVKREWGQRKGEIRLSPKQENEQRQSYAFVEESKRRIAKVEADIAENAAKIGA